MLAARTGRKTFRFWTGPDCPQRSARSVTSLEQMGDGAKPPRGVRLGKSERPLARQMWTVGLKAVSAYVYCRISPLGNGARARLGSTRCRSAHVNEQNSQQTAYQHDASRQRAGRR